MKGLMISVLAGSIVLSGCTTDPATGQKQISKGAVGALIGAAAGAAIDKDKRGRGAAIGAVLGGGVGVYMDKQAAKMKQEMAGTGVDVAYDQATGALNLVMPGNVTFATAKSNIAPQFTTTLGKVASVLSEYNQTTITVSGHTDNVGSAAYNLELSRDRASSVANYLVSNGVTASRINALGFGMSQPIASNATADGKSQNRRVEISINPTANAGS